jgi:hypothetical protein
MDDDRKTMFHTTPPVVLWISGGRTAWGRTVVDSAAQPTDRLRGEQIGFPHLLIDQEQQPCRNPTASSS